MNSILITSARLIHASHKFHQQAVDILIKNGVIADINKKIKNSEKDVQVIDAKGSVVCPGFFDLNVNIGEPGYETKEDVQTGTAAAKSGGFTGIAVHPNTSPSLQSRSEVSLLVNASKGNLVDVHPVGTISKKREGKELAELYDMKLSGAIAFSDGNHSMQQAGLMGRALLYAKGFDGLIISFAQDESIAEGNQINEGIVSTYLGMKGIPNLAEALMVSRDLYLAEYNGAPIHFTTISTAESLELIKKAKAKGLKVTCDVAAHHLLFSDDDLEGFDSNYKVSPPLRTKRDIKALLKGVKDGVVDAIVSQHTPHEIEFKNVEFHIAKPGITGLQTVLPIVLKAGLSEEQLVEKLAIRPRQILGLPVPALEIGEPANLVVFNTDKKWKLDDQSNKSKCRNNPLFNQELTGKVILVYNNNQLNINQ